MKLFLPDPEIEERDGFKPEHDIFGYKDFGGGLANLLAQVDDPLVMALDGPWGSGKSIFTKMWAGHLRNEGFPVIYFDAFANDYMEDAFLALAGEVVTLTKEGSPERQTLLDKMVPAAKTTLRFSAKALARIGTGGLVGDSEFEAVENAAKGVAGDAAGVVDDAIAGLLESRTEQRQTLEDFRKALEALVGELQKDVEENERKPLIFIIDELDRCRPDFALDILERIKHVFSTKDVHFVLITDLEQLANVVRVRYGADIKAEVYLQKFYHLSRTLPQQNFQNGKLKPRAFVDHLFKQLPDGGGDWEYRDSLARALAHLADSHGLQLREVSRIAVPLAVVLYQTGKSIFRAYPIVLGLAAMQVLRPDLFQLARSGELTFSDVDKFLFARGWGDDQSFNPGWRKNFWKFCLLDDLPDDGTNWSTFGTMTAHYNVQRERIVPMLANHIFEIRINV